MFTKSGIFESRGATYESLDIRLRHVSTVPDNPLRQRLTRFGFPTVWRQLVHILSVEEALVHDLQDKPFPGRTEDDFPTMAVLLPAKIRLRGGTEEPSVSSASGRHAHLPSQRATSCHAA